MPRSQENLKKVLVIAIVLITVSLQHHLSQPEYPSKLRQGLSYEREIFSLKPGAPNALRIGWQDLAERVNGNAKYYQALIANIVLGKNKRVHPEKPRITASSVLITFAVLVGYLFSVIRHRSVIEYYTFFYLLTYILWPARQGTRFLVPIIPFLFYYLFGFLKQIIRLLIFSVRQWTNRRQFIEITGIFALTGIFILLNFHENIQLIQDERYRPYYRGGRPDVLADFVQWFRANTPDDTVIVSTNPASVQLFFEKLAPKHRTGRKTFGFAWIDHPAEVLQAMDELSTDYVISVPSGKAATYLHPVLHKYPDRFEAIHRHKIYKKYVIYRVLKP